MAQGSQSLTITLKVRGEEFKRGLADARKALGSLGQAAADGNQAVARSFTPVRTGLRSISEQLEATKRQFILFFQVLPRVGQALAGLGRTADEFKTLSARVRLVSGDTQQATANFRALFDMSQDAGAGMAETVQLFQGLGRSAQELGASSAQILTVVQAIQEAGVLSGAGGAQLSGAIVQLSQMFSGTVVQAQELNSLIDAMPVLVDEIAKGMGQTRGEFITAAKSGEVLVKDVFDAILARAPNIATAFASMPDTIDRASARLRNAFLVWVGGADAAAGSSAAVARMINALAENFDQLANAVLAFGAIAASAGLGRLAAGVADWAAKLRDGVAAQLAANNAARAALATERAVAAQAVVTAQARAAAAAAAVVEARTHLANVQALSIYGERRAAAERAVTAALAEQTAAQNALTGATARAAAASTAQVGRLTGVVGALRGALGLLGGPIGAITTALTLGASAWFLWGSRAESAGTKAKRAIDQANDALQISREQRAGVDPNVQPLIASLRKVEEAYSESQARLAKLFTETNRPDYTAQLENELKKSRELKDKLRELRDEMIAVQKAARERGDEPPEASDRTDVDKFLERYRTDQERLADEIATFRELAAKANLAEAEVLAGIERIKAAFAKKDKTRTDDDGLREIERLVAQLQTERDTLGLTEEQVRAYNIEKLRAKAAGDVAAQAALDTAAALNQEVAALEAAEETRRRLDDAKRRILDEVDPNAPLLRELELIEELKAAYPEYAAAFDEAALRIHERMDELGETSEATGDSMTEMAVQAARNIQSSFADFLFDPFKDGMNGMLSSFVTTIRRMLSELLAAQALRAFFNSMSGLGGGVGSLFGSLAANVKHTGGLAGTGPMRSVPALAFIGAPRYHSGGLAGDEVPAILQRGEEVLTRDDPRHQANGGGSSQGVRIVNVIDPAMTRDYLTSSEGERTILNVLAANQGAVRQILA